LNQVKVTEHKMIEVEIETVKLSRSFETEKPLHSAGFYSTEIVLHPNSVWYRVSSKSRTVRSLLFKRCCYQGEKEVSDRVG